jgi:hypothetical protein
MGDKEAEGGEYFIGLVEEASQGADLVVLGFNMLSLASKGAEVLTKHPRLFDVLFVSAAEEILIE